MAPDDGGQDCRNWSVAKPHAETLIKPGESPIVRVRLRHSWVSFLRFPLTPEQAERLANGEIGEVRAQNPLDITIGPPVCERCGADYPTAPWSCSETTK
jgi:hypothetical protein